MNYKVSDFIIRLNTEFTEKLSINDRNTWTIQSGSGVLQNTLVSILSNPIAEAKTNSADIPAVNGNIDLTENYGQVFYNNKVVEVSFIKEVEHSDEYFAMRDAFAAMQGRMVDFAFTGANSVEWYYTGRLNIASEDYHAAKMVIQVDCYPFMKSVERFGMDIPTETSLDRSTNGWTVDMKPDSTTVSLQANWISAYGNIGDVVSISRALAGDYYTIAMTSLKGGDFTFTGSGSNRVMGKTQTGTLYAEVSIDGSYYDWVTVNGVKVYKPCVKMNYILTRVRDNGKLTLPSNVRIRPELYNLSTDEADILLDGKRINFPENSLGCKFAEAVLPGIRADRSGTDVVCCLTAVGNSAYDNPSCRVLFRKEKLG